MTTTVSPARGTLGRWLDSFDPLRGLWALLTNVKFALFLIGTSVVAMLIGTVIPQLPAPMRTNLAARSAWLELQRAEYGQWTDPMWRLGLFNVFQSWWFIALWTVILAAVAVSTVSRLRPIVRSVHRPQRVVADRYFTVARNRADFEQPGGVPAVEAILRQRHYTVEKVREVDGAQYLFAHRYLWSQYGTVVSHLALIMLMVGGLLTRFGGFDNTLALAEGSPGAPVFTGAPSNQMFITMVDAHRGLDDAGNVIDFHSILEVRRGDEVVTCKATVNDPCVAFGHRLHQAAYFDDIASLRVVGPSGAVLYDDIVDFDTEVTVVPRLAVTGPGGETLFDGPLPQVATETGDPSTRADDVAVGLLAFPRTLGGDPADGLALPVAWRVIDGVLNLAVDAGELRELKVDAPLVIQGFSLAFVGAQTIPALLVEDMPGAMDGRATVQMPVDSDGAPYLVLSGVDDNPVLLAPGQEVTTTSGYVYQFGGRVEASGINIKRDPGDTFIWLAVGMAMLGLGMTFYVPRRRLWIKVDGERTYLAGLAERSTRFGRELRMIGADLGAKDALLPADTAKEWELVTVRCPGFAARQSEPRVETSGRVIRQPCVAAGIVAGRVA